jgi:glycerol-3-phosphate dehydrogenase
VDRLTQERFDLLILGGGITGAGVALDAALNGWRVALIDKGDFASGTSSASSKLVHGGIRYLEHGAFHLVYEALHERRLLLHNAPHLVRPLRFVIPFYERARVRPWKWRAGLTLYDLLAGSSNIRRSRPLSAETLEHEFPGLQTGRLKGGAEYFDAEMDDARLCLEVIRTAAAQGACAVNYVEATAFGWDGKRITGVEAVDHIAGRELVIRARQVLNATGPAVDAVCRLAGDGTGPHLQPTKGVHLVAPPRGLTAAFLLLHPADGRVFFVIPWMGSGNEWSVNAWSKGRGGWGVPELRSARSTLSAQHSAAYPAKTLIGTTDTHFREGVDSLDIADEEVAYLLDGFNAYFREPLAAGDILGSFAGLRPLIRARPGEPSSLSREFRLFDAPSGLLSIAGGKYTTYRRMAEVITRAVAGRLGKSYRCRTRDFPLDGAPRVSWPHFETAAVAELQQRHGLNQEAAAHLMRRYGRRATDVAAYLDKDRALAAPIVAEEPDLRVEFPYQRDQEMALFPADHLLRRTRLGLFRPELLSDIGQL